MWILGFAMRLMIVCCVFVLSFFAAQVAVGAIYKCVNGDDIVYQQSPCPEGEKIDVQTSKGVTQYTPAQPKPYSWADRVNDKFKREKQQEQYLKGKIDNPYLPERTPKQVPQKTFSDGNKTRNCVNASKALDKHKKVMKQGYSAGASNYLRKRKRELARSVKEYCS